MWNLADRVCSSQSQGPGHDRNVALAFFSHDVCSMEHPSLIPSRDTISVFSFLPA